MENLLEVLNLHLPNRILADEIIEVLRHHLHVEQGRVAGDVLEILGVQSPPSLSVSHL